MAPLHEQPAIPIKHEGSPPETEILGEALQGQAMDASDLNESRIKVEDKSKRKDIEEEQDNPIELLDDVIDVINAIDAVEGQHRPASELWDTCKQIDACYHELVRIDHKFQRALAENERRDYDAIERDVELWLEWWSLTRSIGEVLNYHPSSNVADLGQPPWCWGEQVSWSAAQIGGTRNGC